MAVIEYCTKNDLSRTCHISRGIVAAIVVPTVVVTVLIYFFYAYCLQSCWCCLSAPCSLVNQLWDGAKRVWRQKISRKQPDVPLERFGEDMESNRQGQ